MTDVFHKQYRALTDEEKIPKEVNPFLEEMISNPLEKNKTILELRLRVLDTMSHIYNGATLVRITATMQQVVEAIKNPCHFALLENHGATDRK